VKSGQRQVFHDNGYVVSWLEGNMLEVAQTNLIMGPVSHFFN
jgi:hypothetical protein